jgi:hypothetical protein
LKQSKDAHRAAESELATTKEMVAQSAQVLVDSLGRSKALEEELGHLRSVVRLVIMEVLEPHPRSSALTTNLLEIQGEVTGLVTDRVYHGASGVLASVASHYPTLDFEAVGRGYTAGWSADQLRELIQSLVLVATLIEEATTTEWVKEAHRAERGVTLGRDGGQSTEAELSAALITLTPSQGNPPVIPTARLLASMSLANVDEVPQ